MCLSNGFIEWFVGTNRFLRGFETDGNVEFHTSVEARETHRSDVEKTHIYFVKKFFVAAD